VSEFSKSLHTIIRFQIPYDGMPKKISVTLLCDFLFFANRFVWFFCNSSSSDNTFCKLKSVI